MNDAMDDTLGDDTRCPDEGTYVQAVGTIIFVIVWPFVVFELNQNSQPKTCCCYEVK